MAIENMLYYSQMYCNGPNNILTSNFFVLPIGTHIECHKNERIVSIEPCNDYNIKGVWITQTHLLNLILPLSLPLSLVHIFSHI